MVQISYSEFFIEYIFDDENVNDGDVTYNLFLNMSLIN